MSFIGIGRIAYPDVTAVSGGCSDDVEVPLADVAAEPLVDAGLGRAACMN